MARNSALRKADARRNALFVLPMTLFAVVLVALPLIYVLGTSLVQSGQDFSLSATFTLDNYKRLLRADYLLVFFNSLKLAFLTTVVCFLIGYPFGYCMAKASRGWKALLMMLVIIPFWTSALVRIYGWKILLQGNGPVNTVLKSLGLIEKNIKFLGSYGSVLLAMVYCMISFMILPCHSAVDKMDFTLVEAARDLGASPLRVLRDITLPLIMPAVVSGMMLAVAMSIDDVVISFFVTSGETTPLPLKVYTGLRSGGTPEINALSTLMLGAIFVIVGLSQLLRARSDKKLYSSK